MIASRRWQDWATTIVGALFAISPFAFASSYSSLEAWTAYFVGGVIFLVGVAMLIWPQFTFGEAVQIFLGVVTFMTPWVIGFTAITGMAWAAWIAGIALVAVAGYELYQTGTEGRVAPAA